MKIKQSDAESLLAKWVEQEKPKFIPLQKGEVTHEMYAKLIGAKTDTASSRLKALVEAGLWTRREVIFNGKAGWAYKPVEEPK